MHVHNMNNQEAKQGLKPEIVIIKLLSVILKVRVFCCSAAMSKLNINDDIYNLTNLLDKIKNKPKKCTVLLYFCDKVRHLQ